MLIANTKITILSHIFKDINLARKVTYLALKETRFEPIVKKYIDILITKVN